MEDMVGWVKVQEEASSAEGIEAMVEVMVAAVKVEVMAEEGMEEEEGMVALAGVKEEEETAEEMAVPKEEVGRGNDMAASVKGWFAKTCKF